MGQASSVGEMNTEPSDKVNGFQGNNVNNMSINQEKEKSKGPRPNPSGDFRTMPLTAWQKIHANFEAGGGTKEKTLRATAPEWTPGTPIFPPVDAQWSVPVRQPSTGNLSGNGTSHTPEAGSRRPSFSPFGYPGAGAAPSASHAPPYPDEVMRQMMMQKAFYDGWVDAAARAAGAGAAMPPHPHAPGALAPGAVTPPLTPAVQTPVLGGVAASLNAHVQAMQAAQGQPPSPARQVAPLSPGALPNTPSQASTGDLSWHQRTDGLQVPVQAPAGGVIVSGKDSPRSSILKLCGAWGALAAPPAPPKPTVRLATEKGFARAGHLGLRQGLKAAFSESRKF
eukprot:s235_g17.t1